MLKFACLITGDNFDIVASETPASKKKIIALAIAVLIPSTIWLFNGFMLSFQVLGSGIYWAILTGMVCGSIVFLLEKLIIMANGNNWLTLIRICIGFLVAMLGSITLDEVIFKNDIDYSVSKLKDKVVGEAKMTENITFSDLNKLGELDAAIQISHVTSDEAQKVLIAEADGSGGSGNRGIGQITKLKSQNALQKKQALDILLIQKQKIIAAKDSNVNIAGLKAQSAFNEHALLIRIKALFNLIREDGYMMFVYILFTLLMFFFEFLVVVLKLTWNKTNYERKLEMIEEIGAKRIEFLKRRDSPLIDPGIYMPEFEKARIALSKPVNIL